MKIRIWHVLCVHGTLCVFIPEYNNEEIRTKQYGDATFNNLLNAT